MTNHMVIDNQDFDNRMDYDEIVTPRTKALVISEPGDKVKSLLNSKRDSNEAGQKKVSFIGSYPVTNIYDYEVEFPNRILTKQLLKEYFSECEKHTVKPLAKLVKQLEAHEYIDGPLDRLDLDNIIFDQKIIDSIEIIFMNIQIDWLDMDKSLRFEDTCVSFFDILDHYDCVKCLSISNNSRIGVRGWTSVSQFIGRSSTLERVIMNYMVFTEHAISCLCRAMSSSSSLKSIDVGNCYLNGSRLKTLLSSLTNGKSILSELYLNDNKISGNECDAISNLLTNYSHIKTLDLQNNNIQDSGLRKLLTGLLENKDSQLEILQLCNTGITTSGANYIARFFTDCLESGHESRLRSLNLGKNKCGDEGIFILKQPIIKNQTLQRLGLVCNKLTPAGIIAAAEIIADNRALLRVDLRGNESNLAAVIALNQALRHNNSILKINFDTKIKVESGMENELNSVLNEIRLKCIENRNRSRSIGRVDDTVSLISAFSSESVAFSSQHNSNQSAPTYLYSLLSFFSNPFRYSKNKLFGFSKPDADPPAAIKESSEENGSDKKLDSNPVEQELPNPTDKIESLNNELPNIVPNLSAPPESPIKKESFPQKHSLSYNISRFEIRKVSSNTTLHRRTRSDLANSINVTSEKSKSYHLNLSETSCKVSSSSLQSSDTDSVCEKLIPDKFDSTYEKNISHDNLSFAETIEECISLCDPSNNNKNSSLDFLTSKTSSITLNSNTDNPNA